MMLLLLLICCLLFVVVYFSWLFNLDGLGFIDLLYLVIVNWLGV